MTTSVCKRYRVGMPCVSEKCKSHHSSQTKEQFEHLINVACDSIHLNAVIKKFTLAFERYDQEKEVSQKFLVHEVKDFQACRRLYNLLFPKYSLQVASISKDCIRQVRRCAAVKERLAYFAIHSWKKVAEESRWCNANTFILVSQVLYLIGNSRKIGVLLSVEEKAFEKKRASSQKVVCDGMTQDKQRGGYQSFLRLLEQGKRFLYVYGDVLNSANFTIRRFLSLPAWRKSMPLPTLANTALLVEQHLIACLALFARLFVGYEYPVCLPESYLSAIQFWDMVHGDEKRYSLYSAVETTMRGLPPYKGIHQVQRLLEYMVNLMCGKVGHQFNVINDALNSQPIDYVMSGEAERVLVLALTMLCNCGRGIPTPCAAILVQCLRSVQVHDYLPQRIQVALLSMKRATSIQDAIVALEGLLEHRQENLKNLHWNNNSWRFDGHIGVASYNQSFHAGPFIAQASATPQVLTELSDLEMPLELKMPAGYAEELVREHAIADQEAECELAAVKIQRWYRELLSQRQCKGFTKEAVGGLEELQSSPGALCHFDQFKVDMSACSVCGVHLNHELQSDEGRTGRSDSKTSGKERETYKSHTAPGSPHWQKVQEFNQYKRLYMEKLHPLSMAAGEIDKQLRASELKPQGHSAIQSSRDFGLDLQRLGHIRTRVSEAVRQIESQCKWHETMHLEQMVATFEKTIGEVQGILIQGNVFLLVLYIQKYIHISDQIEANDFLASPEVFQSHVAACCVNVGQVSPHSYTFFIKLVETAIPWGLNVLILHLVFQCVEMQG